MRVTLWKLDSLIAACNLIKIEKLLGKVTFESDKRSRVYPASYFYHYLSFMFLIITQFQVHSVFQVLGSVTTLYLSLARARPQGDVVVNATNIFLSRYA